MATISIIITIGCLILLFASLYKDRYDKASFWALAIVINMLAVLLDKLTSDI